MTAHWGFHDLHSFKDYVTVVALCAPDQFPPINVGPDKKPFTLDSAFLALREGLALAVAEKGDRPVFRDCARLVEQAYEAYQSGNSEAGAIKIRQVRKLLGKVPTQ